MTGESKPGDAVADKARDEFDKNRHDRELAIERLRIRAEMRSENFDEDTGVIHSEAARRIAERNSSVPAPARGIKVILTSIDSWQKVAALWILVVGLLIGYWLKSR